MSSRNRVAVIGAGLAGCEAAWQLSRLGIGVDLYDMKPQKMTPAHHSPDLCELVCSNSLKSMRLENACGLLKEEMRRLGSLTMEAAYQNRVAAGDALAVDREGFARYITEKIKSRGNIKTICKEVEKIPEMPVIIATGPLTSDGLSSAIAELVGEERLYFYDAAAPIIEAGSIDRSKTFRASRYGQGADYINCPMCEEEYKRFWEELCMAETAPVHGFEDALVFEGCMPIENLAKRGYLTMAYGPLKPKGLFEPKTGKEPFAVVQLRQDDAAGTLYNMVGFQTRLKFPEQKRVFSMIPGLEKAEFARYGVMHRNTYINSPKVLAEDFSLRRNSSIYFAGQITGVEGYVESAASGMMAGLFLGCRMLKRPSPKFTPDTAMGALARYISAETKSGFQPMNINYGIMEPIPRRFRNKEDKYRLYAERSLEQINMIKNDSGF